MEEKKYISINEIPSKDDKKWNFFRTAPLIRKTNVTKIVYNGHSNAIKEAIEDEKRNIGHNIGVSNNQMIRVKRIGMSQNINPNQ